MFTRKRALIATAAAVSVAALAGCSGGSSSDPTTSGASEGGSESGGTVTLGVIAQVTSFAAANSNWANESPMMQAVYDSLLRMEPDGTISPNLATDWEWSEDRMTLTLDLRDDVTFTDGTAFDADVAAQNILRFRDGTSPNASNLGRVADATAVDADTVEITMSEPDPALEVYLTQNAGLQESPAAFDTADVDTVPIGSGPYTLNVGETVPGTTYVFDKNPDYWNSEDQHYDRVVANVYTDSTAMLNAVQGGQVDVASVIDLTQLDQMTASGYSAVTNQLDWVGLILGDRGGVLNEALADVKVRQAIAYAFDRDAILQAFAAGYGTTTGQIFPTTSPSYDESLNETYPYDPEKAKSLLAEAGYADGLEITMPSTAAFNQSWLTLVQQQLADVGITVVYEDVAPANFISDMVAGKWPATIMILQQDPSDFQLASFQIAADATFNFLHYEDPTVEDLIGQIQLGDEAAGAELNQYIVDQAWFVPFYRTDNTKVVAEGTTAEAQTGNTWPYLWTIKPA
ncbi:ABC transporter substrate-binding protein [Demequina phytophila]|uniref:ABC transporter substrate-binding protein n=1 Tax=Demequina phytophila TaxID=1638981 RepID=UPI000784993D|nr:ABC transporter substrate-binding protein [Demequina phytophila]